MIKHPGVVERVESGKVVVRILSQSACGNCQAKGHCGMAESADKLVDVNHHEAAQFSPGQTVEITLARSLGYKALLLGYIVPFLIIVVSLFILVLTTGNELFAAFVSVVLMLPYFSFLYIYRHKLRKEFHFRINKV